MKETIFGVMRHSLGMNLLTLMEVEWVSDLDSCCFRRHKRHVCYVRLDSSETRDHVVLRTWTHSTLFLTGEWRK